MRSVQPTASVKALVEHHRARVLQAETEVQNRTPRSTALFENRISLSMTEFAARTGLSVKSVERMIKRGEIRALRAGRRLVIPTGAIEAWLNQSE